MDDSKSSKKLKKWEKKIVFIQRFKSKKRPREVYEDDEDRAGAEGAEAKKKKIRITRKFPKESQTEEAGSGGQRVSAVPQYWCAHLKSTPPVVIAVDTTQNAKLVKCWTSGWLKSILPLVGVPQLLTPKELKACMRMQKTLQALPIQLISSCIDVDELKQSELENCEEFVHQLGLGGSAPVPPDGANAPSFKLADPFAMGFGGQRGSAAPNSAAPNSAGSKELVEEYHEETLEEMED